MCGIPSIKYQRHLQAKRPIYLIPTNHANVADGRRQLQTLYDMVKPTVVISSFAKRDLDLVRKTLAAVDEQLAPLLAPADQELIHARLEGTIVPFTVQENERYAARTEAEHAFAFLPDEFRGRYARFEQRCADAVKSIRTSDLSGSLLAALNANIPGTKYSSAQRSANDIWNEYLPRERSFGMELHLQGLLFKEVLGSKDRWLARCVENVVEHLDKYGEGPVNPVAVPVDIPHALRSWSVETLYDRIRHHNPQRIALGTQYGGYC